MQKKDAIRTASVIEIGSSLVRMRISQRVKSGEILELDTLEYPVTLGHEVFTTGKISYDSLKQLSSILTGFTKIMQEYDVSKYKAVGTTALREAQNRAYVVDTLKTRNQISLQILEDNEETALIYGEALNRFSDYDLTGTSHALISYIGTGSIGTAVMDKGGIFFSQNIHTGSLKIKDMTDVLQDRSVKAYQVISEFLDNFLKRLVIHINTSAINTLILTGREAELIANLCEAKTKGKVSTIQKKKLTALYNEICRLTPEQISSSFALTGEQAEILYASVSIFKKFNTLIGVDTILLPHIDLSDSLTNLLLCPGYKKQFDLKQLESTLSCVYGIGQRYRCDMEHARTISEFAYSLFNHLRKFHGLPKKAHILLECAALLQDAGYYVNSKEPYAAAFDLVKHTQIYGFTDRELLLCAHIIWYSDLQEIPEIYKHYETLNQEDQLLVGKMAAILKLARALDYSRKNKVKNLGIKIEKDQFILTVSSDQNLSLEQWAFDIAAKYFEEVYGLDPVLVVNNTLGDR